MLARMRGKRSEAGQAAVELVAVLPLIALLAALVWQALVAGQALWLTASAARSASRAQAVGAGPAPAARRALPPLLERGLRVTGAVDGTATVRAKVPLANGEAATAEATARMEPQR